MWTNLITTKVSQFFQDLLPPLYPAKLALELEQVYLLCVPFWYTTFLNPLNFPLRI
jgi:hypothetical protein